MVRSAGAGRFGKRFSQGEDQGKDAGMARVNWGTIVTIRKALEIAQMHP